ncbi:hypothetical protein LSH36_190g01007, partial [Paralvinella palmiformis]
LPAFKEKFRQNLKLLSYLVATGDKVLVKASTDRFCGTGHCLENSNVHDQKMWSGKNVMGDTLMRVRNELKNPMLV